MTWFDDGGNLPPFEPTLEEAERALRPRDRARCPTCGQYPKLTKEGALRRHVYPWYHEHDGQTCPGSGTQIAPLPGQLGLLEEEPH